MILPPELTLILPEYANSDISNFSLDSKRSTSKSEDESSYKVKEPFFILWIPFNTSKEELKKSIMNAFPSFPFEKSFTCKINLTHPDSENLENKEVIGKILPVSLSTNFLLQIPIIKNPNKAELLHHNPPISGSIYFWSLALKLALQIISEGNFVLSVKEKELPLEENSFDKLNEGTMEVHWQAVIRSQHDYRNFGMILESAPISAYAYIPWTELKEKTKKKRTEALVSPSLLLQEYLNLIVDDLIRKAIQKEKYYSFTSVHGVSPEELYKIEKNLPWEIRLLASSLVSKPDFNIFSVMEKSIPNLVKKWTQIVQNAFWKQGYQFVLDLKIPNSENNRWKIDYLLKLIRNDEIIRLKDFFQKITQNPDAEDIINLLKVRRSILITLYNLSKQFPPLKESMKKEDPVCCELDTNQTSVLLEKVTSKFEEDGIEVQLPSAFSKQGNQRLNTIMCIRSPTAEIQTTIDGMVPKVSDIKDMSFDMNSILTYNWELQIGDKKVSDAEFEKLLKTDSSLVYWNNQWILLDKEEITSIKNTFRNNRTGQISAVKALSLGLAGQVYLEDTNNQEENRRDGPYQIKIEGNFKEIIDILKGNKKPKIFPQPPSFKGQLRPYQIDGYNWLLTMTRMGFNVCLADDMGLGKTIQVISFLLQRKELNIELDKNKENKGNTSLIACPTSVLGNWNREFEKFAPTLKIGFFYGNDRPKDLKNLMSFIEKYDIILTSYGLLRKDIDLLKLVNWDVIILDESQNIKNYKAQQTQAVFSLKSKSKICLTGTPIENHLIELWSMYYFLAPYILGKRTEFIKKYYIPIERIGNIHATEQLRKLISPFLMRRLKSDKKIIKDLPEKQEIKVFVGLSEKQKQLYAEIVNDGLKKIGELESSNEEDNSNAFKRKGLILNTILKLKQVCNHPSQASHQSLDIDEEDLRAFIDESEKLSRLLEILEEVIDSKNKILIFTQFTEMGSILEKIISKTLNTEVLYLHGAIDQKKRDELVIKFQEDKDNLFPVFLLSLKAGGTGLNLTNASNVLHFDRWWNPSVENQATDRAYRIGQVKNVMVYKMICSGTIEEKIDKMIEQKKDLADKLVVSTGEDWINDLSLSELQDLFKLEETW